MKLSTMRVVLVLGFLSFIVHHTILLMHWSGFFDEAVLMRLILPIVATLVCFGVVASERARADAPIKHINIVEARYDKGKFVTFHDICCVTYKEGISCDFAKAAFIVNDKGNCARAPK